MTTYRAAGWVSSDKQSSVRLTTEEQSNFSDDDLIKAAMEEANNVGLEIGDGEIIVSLWSE